MVDAIELPNAIAGTFPFYSNTLHWLIGANPHRLTIPDDRVFADAHAFVTWANTELKGETITLAYDADTTKLLVTNTGTDPLRLVSSYRHVDDPYSSVAVNNAADRLGFTQSMADEWINPGSSLAAEGILRMLRTNCYYITCDAVTGSRQAIVPRPGENKPILARVSATNFGNLSQFPYATATQFNTQLQQINSFKFEVLDDELFPVDLGGQPVTFTMRVSTIH